VTIVVLLVLGEGGDDGPASEQGEQGVDDGPVAPFADACALELKARGYTPLTTVNELRQVGRLSR
jgi:hypothetical protein